MKLKGRARFMSTKHQAIILALVGIGNILFLFSLSGWARITWGILLAYVTLWLTFNLTNLFTKNN